MKKLFNLTHNGHQYISTLSPSTLPEKDFSFVEISYINDIVTSVSGSFDIDGESDQIVLSDLDLSQYLKKLEELDLNHLKIHFIGKKEDEENEEHKDDINKKFFILSLCSYLIYFYFMKFPEELSLDLLDNSMFSYLTSFSPINELEREWIKQVAIFHRTFSKLFKNISSNSNQSKTSSKVEITEDQKKYIANFINYELKYAVKKAVDRINSEADQISEEIREYKKKSMRDVSKKKMINKEEKRKEK